MSNKEFFKLFFSFFWDKDFLFGVIYGLSLLAVICVLGWLL